MPDKTALAESAQALFCAFADYVGLAKMKKQFTVFNMITHHLKNIKWMEKNKLFIQERIGLAL